MKDITDIHALRSSVQFNKTMMKQTWSTYDIAATLMQLTGQGLSFEATGFHFKTLNQLANEVRYLKKQRVFISTAFLSESTFEEISSGQKFNQLQVKQFSTKHDRWPTKIIRFNS